MIYLPKKPAEIRKKVDHKVQPSQVSTQENIKKTDAKIWFNLMIYLPLPFCRKKRFLAKYGLTLWSTFFLKKGAR